MTASATRTGVILAVASLAGFASLAWPLVIRLPGAEVATVATFVFGLVLALIMAVVIAELTGSALDVKGLALLGVLAAVGAIVRPLGAGVAGLEPTFFVLIVGGRVFGPSFGFAQGAITLFASALLTGGIGPWLPYQMIAAALVGTLAGLLPRASGRAEIAVLAAYGLVSGFVYGWLTDLATWPFGLGAETAFSYDPDAGTLANLHRFMLYNLATSMGWNLGRGLTSAVLAVLLGPGLLRILYRAARRADFGASAS